MSTIKTITHPSGQQFRLGRNQPAPGHPRLSLSQYLVAENLPPVPAECNYFTPATAPVVSDMFQNDRLGCCVIAAAGHLVGVATGNAGDLFHYSEAQIIADYSAVTGYVPGEEATDNGTDEVSAFQYWQQHGFANGTKLAGWIHVDPTNQQEIQTALYLFEGIFFGIGLPDAWLNPPPAAPLFFWDVAGDPNPDNGHAFLGGGCGPRGVDISTWGVVGEISWGAIAKYAGAPGGELYTLLTPDIIAKAQGKAPNGIAWADLVSDFNKLGGNVTA